MGEQFTWKTVSAAAVPADVLRVPATEVPCGLHTHTSGERPASTELHHIFPLELQKKIWKDVDRDRAATIRDRERTPTCGSGHSDVHLAIEHLMHGKRMPRGIGPKELALAKEALERYDLALLPKGRARSGVHVHVGPRAASPVPATKEKKGGERKSFKQPGMAEDAKSRLFEDKTESVAPRSTTPIED